MQRGPIHFSKIPAVLSPHPHAAGYYAADISHDASGNGEDGFLLVGEEHRG